MDMAQLRSTTQADYYALPDSSSCAGRVERGREELSTAPLSSKNLICSSLVAIGCDLSCTLHRLNQSKHFAKPAKDSAEGWRDGRELSCQPLNESTAPVVYHHSFLHTVDSCAGTVRHMLSRCRVCGWQDVRGFRDGCGWGQRDGCLGPPGARGFQ